MSQTKIKNVNHSQWLKFLPRNNQATKEKRNDIFTKMGIPSILIHNNSSNKTDRNDIASNNNKMTINDNVNYDIKGQSFSLCPFDNFDTFSNESSLMPSNNNQDKFQIDYSKLKTIDNHSKQKQIKGFNVFFGQELESKDNQQTTSDLKTLTNNIKIEDPLSLLSISQCHNKNNVKSKFDYSSFDDDNTTMISKNQSARGIGIGYQLYSHNSNLLSLEMSNHNSRDSSLKKENAINPLPKQLKMLNQSQINSYQKISTYRSVLPSSAYRNHYSYSKGQKSHLYKNIPKENKSNNNIMSNNSISKEKNSDDNNIITKTNHGKDNKSISHYFNKKKIPPSSQCHISQRSLLRNYSNTINKANRAIKKQKDNTVKINSNHPDNNEVVNLIEDIKEQYQQEEKNKIIKESELLAEISMLKSKLKEMTVNEINNQIELEKLRKKVNTTNVNHSIKKNTTCDDEYFSNELNQLSKDLNVSNTTKYNPFIAKDTPKLKSYLYLCREFKLNKYLIYDKALEKDFIDDKEEKENIIKLLNDNPTLKGFINTIANRLNLECDSRLLLEEKSLKIFSNDIKAIDVLEKKIKKLEKKARSANVSLNSNDISIHSINSC